MLPQRHEGKIRQMRKDIEKFIKDMRRIKYIDPDLAWKYKMSGSVNEGTKVNLPDEMDCVCLIQLLEKYIVQPDCQAYGPSHIMLYCKQDTPPSLRSLFDWWHLLWTGARRLLLWTGGRWHPLWTAGRCHLFLCTGARRLLHWTGGRWLLHWTGGR